MATVAEIGAASDLPYEVILYLLEPGEPPGTIASVSPVPVLFVYSGDPRGPSDRRSPARQIANPEGLSILPRQSSRRQLAAAIAAVAAGLAVHSPEMISSQLAPRLHVSSRSADGAGRGDLGSREGNRLTAREQEVLAMMAGGLPNKTIAAELGITSHTVKFHIASIMQKLDAASRTEAVTVGLRKGIILL